MSAEILSKKLENGMVLVGEPTKALESAAFTFLRRPVAASIHRGGRGWPRSRVR